LHGDEDTAFLRNVGNISRINTCHTTQDINPRTHRGKNPTALKKYVKESFIVLFEVL